MTTSCLNKVFLLQFLINIQRLDEQKETFFKTFFLSVRKKRPLV